MRCMFFVENVVWVVRSQFESLETRTESPFRPLRGLLLKKVSADNPYPGQIMSLHIVMQVVKQWETCLKGPIWGPLK